MDDFGGSHLEKCHCFECWCAKQVRRVVKSVNSVGMLRRRSRRERLAAAHDEMLPPSRLCLPNLDYYDNREPKPEPEP